MPAAECVLTSLLRLLYAFYWFAERDAVLEMHQVLSSSGSPGHDLEHR